MNDFQIQRQCEPNWCWAAVTASLFDYFYAGTNLKQSALAAELFGTADNDQGASLEAALDAGSRLLQVPLPHRTLSNWHLNFQSIREWIDLGIPIGVLVRWYDGPIGHFVLIVGYSVSQTGEGWLDIADPLYEPSTVPYDSFVSAYERAGFWLNTYLATKQ